MQALNYLLVSSQNLKYFLNLKVLLSVEVQYCIATASKHLQKSQLFAYNCAIYSEGKTVQSTFSRHNHCLHEQKIYSNVCAHT